MPAKAARARGVARAVFPTRFAGVNLAGAQRAPRTPPSAPSARDDERRARRDRRGATPIQSSTPSAPAEELDTPRKYHFEVRGADAKRAFDRSKIKCMCHEVSEATTANFT